MRTTTSLFLAVFLTVAIGLVALGATGTVMAKESADNPDDEDWTDGPGDFTEWNVYEEYGIHPITYFQLWSGNEDDPEKELDDKRDELNEHLESEFDEENMSYIQRLNAISMWEYASQLDHSFVEHPARVALQWNSNDLRNFSTTEQTSKVPEDVEVSSGGAFQDTNVIKDAYIVEHSIHPSITQYYTDPNSGETRTGRYVMTGADDVEWLELAPTMSQRPQSLKPQSRALIDYRIDPPNGWKVEDHGVNVYRVSDAMCRLGDDGSEWSPDSDDSEENEENERCGIWGKTEDPTNDHTPMTFYEIERNGDYPHEWDSSSGRNDVDDQYTFQQTIDFFHEAQIEATIVNEDNGDRAVVTHDVYHETSVRVNTFDNIYLQSAEMSNGRVQTHVFNPEPWHYVSVAADIEGGDFTRYGVTTGWEYVTMRDERFDTMTVMSEDGEETVGSEVQPLDVYSYPATTGPVPWPKDSTIRDRITVRDYQPADRAPPELPDKLELPNAVNNRYSEGMWALFEYDPADLPTGTEPMKNFAAYGAVDGIMKTIDSPQITRELQGTNLEMEIVDEEYDLQEDESVTVRFTLETNDGEPINTEEAPAPLFEELDPSDPAIHIKHSDQRVYTNAQGEAVADVDLEGLDEGDPLQAEFVPHEWYLVEEAAPVYERDSAIVYDSNGVDNINDRMGSILWRFLALAVLFGWIWVFVRFVYASVGAEDDVADHLREFFR